MAHPHFYTVSKAENIDTINHTIAALAKFYPNTTYAIICPEVEIPLFERNISINSSIQISLINEDEIISLPEFQDIVANILLKEQLMPDKHLPLNWYYQQVLKISYLISDLSMSSKIMIDADTELIRPIRFFDADGRSIVYTTPYEHNPKYKITAAHIANVDLATWHSSVVQLMSISSSEYGYITKSFNDYLPKEPEQSIGQWISEIVVFSTLRCHNDFNGSHFSEQDLVAFLHLLNGSMCCGNLKFLRNRVTGYLSKWQIAISRFIGITHVTYELWQIRTPKNKTMCWKDFLLLLLYQQIRLLIPASLVFKINCKTFLK